MPQCKPTETPSDLPAGSFQARLLFCSHMHGPGFSAPKTEDEVWQRILGQDVTACSENPAHDPTAAPTIAEIRNRLAYDGMTDPILEFRHSNSPAAATC